jgi:hypothetical protein
VPIWVTPVCSLAGPGLVWIWRLNRAAPLNLPCICTSWQVITIAYLGRHRHSNDKALSRYLCSIRMLENRGNSSKFPVCGHRIPTHAPILSSTVDINRPHLQSLRNFHTKVNGHHEGGAQRQKPCWRVRLISACWLRYVSLEAHCCQVCPG